MGAELSALATQDDLPADLLRRLLRHPGARRSAALLRRDLTDDVIEEIITLGSTRSLAGNSSLPARVRVRFVEHPDPAVRCAVAASIGDEPPGVLARLAGDADPSVRWFLTMNDRLPPELLARLAADPEPRVRSAIVQGDRVLPDNVRRALFTDEDADVRRSSLLAYVPPADLLPVLPADPETRAAAVAHAVPTPALAADSDSEVREAVAAHPDLPVNLRELLAEDPDHFVRSAIADREDTPATLRERLLATLDPDDPVAQWMQSFRSHVCPPRTLSPTPLTRQQAEALLARAGL
ncbi:MULTISPECIES: hypothetical protein [unclassified Streptomyces]|uniref:hypothetical protein n=1 Tax=unclassified Streptomyces TaxID=2593676 RepID=UPI001F48D5F9|nr:MULTISPECIES: hypothetical protein [unclassified Streptomyces]